MKKFIDDNFLLHSKTAQELYHGFAKAMPIIDYHNHQSPDQIANDINFENLTQLWLYGDHYKWRAMRANGVQEKYITGDAGDYEKFEQWAATVPYTLRNPLYHWTHLELQRYFDIDTLLSPATAREIYDACSAKLKTPAYSVKNLLRKMNVQILCTTDDPTDSLEHHRKIKADGFEIKVLPAFRPDRAMNVDDVVSFNAYVNKLQEVSNILIASFDDYLQALKSRHDFFAEMGCCISDHGLEQIYAMDYNEAEIKNIFRKLTAGESISQPENMKFKSAMLVSRDEKACASSRLCCAVNTTSAVRAASA